MGKNEPLWDLTLRGVSGNPDAAIAFEELEAVTYDAQTVVQTEGGIDHECERRRPERDATSIIAQGFGRLIGAERYGVPQPSSRGSDRSYSRSGHAPESETAGGEGKHQNH
jgi:hypothetical protein